MLEGEYLELVDDLKKKFDEKELELNKLRERNMQLEKDILSAFGLIRIIDYFASSSEIDEELKILISSLRTFLSDTFDDILHN
tara:strand:+ start:1685 stop:1933 length:249 start_codon:yes stop_codon:yes gene_type:complete